MNQCSTSISKSDAHAQENLKRKFGNMMAALEFANIRNEIEYENSMIKKSDEFHSKIFLFITQTDQSQVCGKTSGYFDESAITRAN